MAESPAQHEALELLYEIDNRGRRLTRDEVAFVADLIDRDVRQFTVGQINRLRSLHRKKVEGVEEEDEL